MKRVIGNSLALAVAFLLLPLPAALVQPVQTVGASAYDLPLSPQAPAPSPTPTPTPTPGNLYAWGYNEFGQLGDNTTTMRLTPVPVKNLTGVIAVSAGESHSLALKSDGTVCAWGRNNWGQLGNNSTTNSLTPVPVPNLTGVIAISAGWYHSLALKSDGTVCAWGFNVFGQLGDNTTTNKLTPVPVKNLNGVIAVSGGETHSLALKSDGTVCAWGNNGNGHLGDNTTTDRHTPVQVSNLTGVTAISGGYRHSLALKSDGTVCAWGFNIEGQVGDNTTTDKHIPVQVQNITGVIAVEAGSRHCLALKSDGTVCAWGDNGLGQLGDNTYSNRLTPVQVRNLTGVIAVEAGWAHSLTVATPPTVTTDNATNISGWSVLLNGTLTNLGGNPSVQVSFQWGVTDNYTNATAATTAGATGPFSFYLTGLSDNTTYHFRAKAVGDGTSYGADRTFTTLVAAPPLVTTDNATSIMATSAVLNGTLTGLGSAASVIVSFQMGLSENYTSETTPTTTNATGAFTFNATGLSPDTLYHFRARAAGDLTSYGADRTFRTQSGVAAVTTDNATNISGRSVLLNGTLTSLGGNPSVQVSFQWGVTDNYTNATAATTTGATGPFSFYLTGLSDNTTYHFRARALGAAAGYGADRSFTTEVVHGVRIEGLTYEAKGVVLGGVTITLNGTSSNVSDSNGIYRITANTTGSHTVVAGKTGYRSQTQTVNVTEIGATYALDFKADSGLVPNAPDASYVLACVNKWKFPTEGLGLSLSKVLSVINAWKFPL